MTRLGAASIALSAVLHASVCLAFMDVSGRTSYDAGSGTDEFTLEKGIAIEGIGFFGTDSETVQAVDIPPVEAQQATPPVPEAKPLEEPPPVLASSSASAPAEIAEQKPEPPRETPPEPPREVVQAQEAVPAQMIEAREQSSSRATTGGDAKLLALYRGELSRKLQKAKVLPRTRASGRVIVRFTISPSGALLSREIEHSSGYPALDEAAITALDRAAPFPPIPAAATTGPLALSVPFDFVAR